MVKRVAAVLLVGVAACGWVAGLPSDYVTLHDASVEEDASDGAGESGLPDVLFTDDGGAGSDPGWVTCGDAACGLFRREACCAGRDAEAACMDKRDPACAQRMTACDEAADCPPDEVCCATALSPGAVRIECRGSCPGPHGCKTSLECDGEPCIAWTCGERVVRTCGGRDAQSGCP